MPILGLGTWLSKPGEVKQAVEDAIDAGYRHLDCAYAYLNEKEVGDAIKNKINAGVIKRADLFITSKLWNTFHSKHLVETALKETLTNLGVEYLDLFLIHWPMGFQEGGEIFPKNADGEMLFSDVDYIDTWKAMEDVKKKGLVKSIGLSNFNSEQIKRINAIAEIKPAVLQVECNPYLNQEKLISFAKSNQIAVTGYSPLGAPERPWAKPTDPKLLEDPRITTIAKKYNKQPAQILIRFQIDRGVIVIPKSVNKERIKANLNVFDFKLSSDDIDAIKSINCNGRALLLEWVKDHKHYPFNIEY